MKIRSTGFVLLTTIMMIVILALLVLSLMQSLFLYIRSSNQVVINHKRLTEMEQIVDKLDLTQSGYVGQYIYVVEDLGLHPCLKINQLGSHHWQVTIATTQPPHVVLQLRIARPIETEICESTAIQIDPGIVSWRKTNVLLDTNTMHDKIFD